jgi:hypothetical protein
MGLRGRPLVRMLMVLVVDVQMLVKQALMLVQVVMLRAYQRKHTGDHEERPRQPGPARQIAKHDQRE